MEARLQKRVQRYGWDKAVAHYERSWPVQLEPAQTALLELARLAPGERVIAPYRQNAGYAVPGEFVVVAGTK